MNKSILARDLRALYTLFFLGARTKTSPEASLSTPITAYQALKKYNTRLNLIGASASSGAFYHMIQNMIKTNLIRVAVINSNRSDDQLELRPKGSKALDEGIDECLATSEVWEYAKIVGCLDLITLCRDDNKLAPWIRRLRANLIKFKHISGREVSANRTEIGESLALSSWVAGYAKNLDDYLSELGANY